MMMTERKLTRMDIIKLQPRRGDIILVRIDGSMEDIQGAIEDMASVKDDLEPGVTLIFANMEMNIEHYDEQRMASIGWMRVRS
jgi:hypothetical protein